MVKLWIKKISVILITFMTLGLYIPPTYLDVRAEDEEVIPNKEENMHEELSVTEADEQADLPDLNRDYFVNAITEQAKGQTVSKLGPKIYKQVETEFTAVILPEIEHVLKGILVEAEEDTIPYYGITEQPAPGYGERIFNVYNYQKGVDVARFHVRRDNRPGEGYWFNFHYHLSDDGFENHHVIGELYYDKNTPPKWMT